ncbi:MAG: DNA polymerase/3'-5' exonuclease PolX [Methanomicrobiales archaeon]|nr:DNA polymerase/3'-5' exonuclease PolX [Methanomicrobiales archaeon]
MEEVNSRAAALLALMGELLEISGEDTFKVRAYYRASEEIRRLTRSIEGMTEEELLQVTGIGRAIAKKVQEIVRTGTFHELEEAKARIPSTLLDILQLEGVGPKTVRRLWQKLEVETLDDLEKAARAHRIRGLKGFGERREREILEAVQRRRTSGRRMTRDEAETIVRTIAGAFEGSGFEVAGSYRRGKSTLGDLDIVTTASPSAVNQRLRRTGCETIEEGESRTSVRCGEKRVDIRFTRREEYGTMLIYLTGSKNFNIRLREIALQRGMKLNEYGIEEKGKGETRRFATEEEVFTALGMDYIPPELREDGGEIEAVMAHRLPHLLVESEIRGDLHVHSSWSDGHLSLDQLAEAGAERHYQYLLCSDHSSTLGIAHGLDGEAVRRQISEIERVNRDSECTLLSGIEVDILADGTTGLSASVLKDLDLVIGSVHSAFKQDRDVMTRRIIRAIENEHIDIIGHPTGRILGQREPYDVDMERVIEAAKDGGKALEINASPHRLDLDDLFIKEARERGVHLSIGTDAHSAQELAYMRYGVMVARRGWCRPSDLLNTRDIKELLEFSR